MGLYSGGLIIGTIFASQILGGLFSEGLIIIIIIFLVGGGGGGLLSEFYGVYIA